MSESNESVRVLFVCTGNICRSPTAHAVFRERVRAAGLAARIDVDSAGTHGYHVGQAPDRRAREAAAQRGYELGDLRARQVDPADLMTYDYVLAMDGLNLSALEAIAVPDCRAEIARLLDYVAEAAGQDVPDPYYGARNGFEEVLDLVESGADRLLAHVRARHGL
ncbi:MAG: low molecular weight protein-tyrosine-phosphatase [Halofilum sp. (in: g-proteobacteria)]